MLDEALGAVDGDTAQTRLVAPSQSNSALIRKLWYRGGFPLSYLAETDRISLQWRRDFVQSYIQRDAVQWGIDSDNLDLLRFWELLAVHQGDLWNHGRTNHAFGMPRDQIDGCIAALKKLLFVRELRPWSQNAQKQLTRSPRYYIRDSGLLHALLNFRTAEEVEESGFCGKSWEGFVIEALINAAPNSAAAFFYRHKNRDELDLVLEFSAINRWAIEIKHSTNPKVQIGNVRAAEKVGASRRILVHNGSEVFNSGKSDFDAMPLYEACQAIAAA